MIYENQKKLQKVIDDIVLSESEEIVNKFDELKKWRQDNLKKVQDFDKQNKELENAKKTIDMLTKNITFFMKNIGAELKDESWQDGCPETGETFGEWIEYYLYDGFELGLSHKTYKDEEKEIY